ncbi:hypothetical protein [Pedobacter cryoconitis]|nr:hypothetical protein [Pedobacter cryoconitis]
MTYPIQHGSADFKDTNFFIPVKQYDESPYYSGLFNQAELVHESLKIAG